jgi:hemerythrin-like domain-containing protein
VKHKTLSILRAEHRVFFSIARLLESEALLCARGENPNLELVTSIIRYLREYPCQHHHPKEERVLFPALKRRCPEALAAIERLERDHAVEEDLIKALDVAAARLSAESSENTDAECAAFADAAAIYARFLEGHAREEETRIFPLAERILTEAEWAPLDSAFSVHDDPILGDENEEFKKLRLHIASLGAPPIGGLRIHED